MRTSCILTLLGIPAFICAAFVLSGLVYGLEHVSVAVATNFQPVPNYDQLSAFELGCFMLCPPPEIVGGGALCVLAALAVLLCLDRHIECWEEKRELRRLPANRLRPPERRNSVTINSQLVDPYESPAQGLITSLRAFVCSLDPGFTADLDRADLTRRVLLMELDDRFRNKRHVFGAIGMTATAIGIAIAAIDLQHVTHWMRHQESPSRLALVLNTAHSLGFLLFGLIVWVTGLLVSLWLSKRHDRLIAEADKVTIFVVRACNQSVSNRQPGGNRPSRWLSQPYKSIQIRPRSVSQAALTSKPRGAIQC